MYPLPAAILSVASYVAAPLLLEGCRPQKRPLISPLNWFFLLFGLELVVTPIVVLLHGPYVDLLPATPSNVAVNFALLVYSVGYWSFCVGVHLFRKNAGVLASAASHHSSDTWFPPAWLILVYLLLGVVGVAAFFKNPTRLLLYFLSPQEYLTSVEEGSGVTSLTDAASVFLRAFFPFGLMLLWCRATLSKVRFSRLGAGLLLLLVAVTSPIYSYERSALVVPMLSIGAVFTKRKSRGATLALLALLCVMASLVAGLTAIRLNPDLPGAQDAPRTSDLYQGYAMAPQYLGYLIEATHYARSPGFGSVTFASVMTPLPIVGKPFRDSSGTAIFGQFSYRSDLPAPFAGELFLDFNLLGVIAGFGVVGLFVAKLQNRFDLASEPLEIYILQFLSIWMSYTVASSISVVSLAAFYLAWPIYAFLLYRQHRRRRALSTNEIVTIDLG